MAMLTLREIMIEHVLKFLRALTVTRRPRWTLKADAAVQNDGPTHDDPPKQDAASDEASQSAVPVPQPGSKLLSLPAELRMMIYRDALTADTRWVDITPTSHEQPGLLRTCRQIRQEATHLYFTENAFMFHVIDLRMIKPKYSSGHWVVKTYNGKSMRHAKDRFVSFTGRADWDNLKEWLRLCYEGEMSHFAPHTAPGWPNTLGEVFGMIVTASEEKNRRTWDEMQLLLGPSRIAVQRDVRDQIGFWR